MILERKEKAYCGGEILGGEFFLLLAMEWNNKVVP
jgi:hypothetical protein